MKKGFTLVELSIVLVIIGLLIGGILIGQSLIESVRINRLATDIQQYEIATIQFYKKFKKFPGDSTLFTPPGDGDNMLDWGSGCGTGANAALSNWESAQVWTHLSQAKMISVTYPAYSPSGTCAGGVHTQQQLYTGKMSPYTKLSPEVNETAVSGYASDRFSYFASKTGPSANFSFNFFTSPLDTLALENKFGGKADDGTARQTGITNASGYASTCFDIYWNTISCSDATAAFGMLNYYLPAQ